nr:zf-CCHC domain-containing protein [Tanacetum cinerariifolium]
MVTDLEDSKTHIVGGVWSGEYMDHGFTKSMSEFDRCYTMLQELRSVIVGGALIHKNREGSKHKGKRIRLTIGDFGGNCAGNQSPFNDGRIEEWKEKKEDRVSTTKIFHSKILINNSVCSLIIDGCSIHNLVSIKSVDFLKLPMNICPIEGYQVCRVPVTIGKSYKVEVLCIVDDIDECYILLGRPWQCEVNGKSWIDRWEYGRCIKKYEGFRLDMKRKSIEDKVRREKVFKVDETLNIENSRVSFLQVRGINVDETKVNTVRDWSSPKTLPEVRNNKVANMFKEEDELEYVETLNGEAKQVTYDVQRTLCSPKVSGSLQRNKIFQTKCLVNEKICYMIIDGESCQNLVSKALVKAFKLPIEPHLSPYQIGRIKKDLALKVTEICKVPLAIGKHYNELVTFDVVDMEEFQAEKKENGISYALVVKGVEDVMENTIPEVIKPLLVEFGKIVTDDTLGALPPLRNIQHQIDLSRKTSLLVSISSEILSFDSIKELYAIDEGFGNIWMELKTKQHRGEFLSLDGYLFKGNSLCIPKTSVKSQLVKEIHAKGLSALDYDDGSRPEEQHLVVSCSDEEILKFPTQPATTEISVENGSNLEDFLIVLTRKEADIIGSIMAVEDEPFMMLESGPNIIKKDFSNDFDGQHSTEEKVVCAQRRTWDPSITWLKILKEHLEDKINDNAYVIDLPNTMIISDTFNVSHIYEFHSEDVNEGTHSRTSSSKKRGSDDDMIQELAEEYMVF